MSERAGAILISTELRQEELFPIREVSRLTGVNPVTLRAWERRYGLICPTRTDSGHRLYSATDIETVRAVLGWIERGVPVSKVGRILARSQAVKAPAPVHDDGSVGEWGAWQARVRQALIGFDAMQLSRLYGQAFALFPMHAVFEDIFMPVWRDLLVRRDTFGVTSEWLFLDGFLRACAVQRLQQVDAEADVVILAPLPGPSHELELLQAALLLGGDEFRVRIQGGGQPLAELALVCEKVRPQALVLFANAPVSPESLVLLQRLALEPVCPVALAGEAADLASEALAGSSIACLGSEGQGMARRLRQFLEGHLDT